MRDDQIAWAVIGGVAIIMAILIFALRRRSSTIAEGLEKVIDEVGWQQRQRLPWTGRGLRGIWNGYDVRVEHRNRYKGVPERLLTKITAEGPGRLYVKRRTNRFFSKPFTWFGPPLVSPMSMANRDEFWIRADSPMLVETLLVRGTVAPLLEQNLIASFDELRVTARGVEVTRALDVSAVKKKFGRPAIEWQYDLPTLETIAREEWQLAVATVEALSLRPHR
jgi:hypothetical protein